MITLKWYVVFFGQRKAELEENPWYFNHLYYFDSSQEIGFYGFCEEENITHCDVPFFSALHALVSNTIM